MCRTKFHGTPMESYEGTHFTSQLTLYFIPQEKTIPKNKKSLSTYPETYLPVFHPH
jgi:hypothetical protein